MWAGAWNRRPLFENWAWRVGARKMNVDEGTVDEGGMGLRDYISKLDQESVDYGWEVHDLKFYSDRECRTQILLMQANTLKPGKFEDTL